jgi:sugar/nucleoside kinase (ribokinase family)
MVPGGLAEIGPALLATGGTPSNTGRTLYRLGFRTCLIGKVGDDPFGKIILDLLREDDPALADHIVVAPGETSSYTIVISPPGTDRFFMHNAGANHTFGADEVPCDLLGEARLFHYGYPPYMKRMYSNDGAELVEMYRQAKTSGVITSLDMALPDPNGPSGQVNWRCVLKRCLPYVDIFLPSLDEAMFMLWPNQKPSDSLISDIGAELLEMGARIVVLKLGSRGLYLRTGPEGAPFLESSDWSNRELWAPCFRPEPLIGTTGSGDATIAGFLAGILRGQSVESALTSAVAVGACNVEAADALSGIRSWEATQARIASGWARSPVKINARGWAWDAACQLWIGPCE